MSCVYLTKTKKNDLVFQYSSEHERYDIKSTINNDLILSLSNSLFSSRKLKEFETERDTTDIVSLRVDSENYDIFLTKLMSSIKERIDSTNTEIWLDLENEDAIEESESLQELLSISLFLRRYYGLSKDKKYKDYTFYIIPPANI
ncbi:hypothetical protein OC525_22210 [Vibrio vulnificus]|nr:hypothetical protein [Vibrio vulnificus]